MFSEVSVVAATLWASKGTVSVVRNEEVAVALTVAGRKESALASETENSFKKDDWYENKSALGVTCITSDSSTDENDGSERELSITCVAMNDTGDAKGRDSEGIKTLIVPMVAKVCVSLSEVNVL